MEKIRRVLSKYKWHFAMPFLLLAFYYNSIYAQSKAASADSIDLNQGITPSGDIRDTYALITGGNLVQDDFPGSWPMFGKDFRMKIGGYVKVDALYDFDGTTDRTQFLMSTIPVEGQPEYENEGYFNFFARETRFNIDVRRTGEGKIPLKLFLEGDFWSDGLQLRLRHAYIVVGDFIIGQTWTTLTFLESLPFMIDFAAGDALFGGRSTQVRYQKKIGSTMSLGIGLENLNFLGIENPDTLSGMASAQLPMLAVRFDYRWNSGVVFLGSSAAQLNWDGGADGPDARALQFAFVLAGRQNLGKKNYISWNLSAGEGSGENILAFAGSNANGVLNTEGKLNTMPSMAFVLGFMHKWAEKFSSNVSYAYGWLETPPSRAPFALKRGGIGHVNLIYSPLQDLSFGVEYIWGAQRTSNDAFGKARRIQIMAKFDF